MSGERPALEPEPVERVLGDRVVGVGRNAVVDQSVGGCMEVARPGGCASCAGVGEPEGYGQAGAVDVVPRRYGATTDAAGNACRSQALQAKGDEAKVAQRDRLGVGQKPPAPGHRLHDVDIQAFKNPHPGGTEAQGPAHGREGVSARGSTTGTSRCPGPEQAQPDAEEDAGKELHARILPYPDAHNREGQRGRVRITPRPSSETALRQRLSGRVGTLAAVWRYKQLRALDASVPQGTRISAAVSASGT